MSIRLKGHGYKTKKAPRPGGGSRGNILREVSRMIFSFIHQPFACHNNWLMIHL